MPLQFEGDDTKGALSEIETDKDSDMDTLIQLRLTRLNSEAF